MDMDTDDLVLAPSKWFANWSDEESDAYGIAMRYLRKTSRMHDDSLSVRTVESFEEGETLSVYELEAKVRALFAEAEARKREKAEGERAAYAEAARSGEPKALRSWVDECDDPREECSYDHVTVYAMPNGATRMVRQHTW